MSTTAVQITENERRAIINAAKRINNLNMGPRLGFIIDLLAQNAAMLREINQHREEKGIQPWKSYEFEDAKP